MLSDKDLIAFNNNAQDIMLKASKLKMKLVEPFEKQIEDMNNIVLDYIKKNKRKIYGGYALNMHLVQKDPSLDLYPNSFGDIDFYSTDPMGDLVNLCNILHDKGYTKIMGKEGAHRETYKINSGDVNICDISYVPKNIFARMPYKVINDYMVTDIQFILIDHLRLINDIMFSDWRLEKTIKRLHLIQKHFNLPIIPRPIIIQGIKNQDVNNTVTNMILFAQQYCEENNNTLAIGLYAYNYYIHASKIHKKYIVNTELPYFEFIASDYEKTATDFVNKMFEKYPEDKNHFVVTEHYPFFQFFGYTVVISYKNIQIAKIYSTNKKCLSYNRVKSLKFYNNRVDTKTEKYIYIGGYSLVYMYSVMMAMYSRVNNNDIDKNIYYTICSHLLEAQRYYLDTNNKTIIDDTIFAEFITNCIGVPVSPIVERQELINVRKLQNKPYVITYDPADPKHRAREQTKIDNGDKNIYTNASGNPIINASNKRLMKNIDIIIDADEEDEEDKKDKKNNKDEEDIKEEEKNKKDKKRKNSKDK